MVEIASLFVIVLWIEQKTNKRGLDRPIFISFFISLVTYAFYVNNLMAV